MAAKYFRAGVTNWDADASWSTTSGGAADTTKPTAADDTFLDANSANCTINATAVCRSINCTGYTGTLTHAAGVTLTIGDGTAGASNIALKFVAGMTYTLGSGNTSKIFFASTSGTQQTIDWGGKTTADVEFSGNGGNYQYVSAHTMAFTTTILTLTRGTLDTNGQTCTWGSLSSSNSNTRVLTLGASAISITGTGNAWSFQTVTNSTINAGTSVITLSGAGSNFIGGTGRTYYDVRLNGSGTSVLDSSSTFTNLTRTGSASKTDRLDITASTTTITGTFTLAGNSATNRLIVQSTTVGTAKSIVNTGATETWSNVDFQDISLSEAFDASAITGLSGDCGGNSGITFTTAETQTCTMSSNQNWQASGIWTSRVPLPQDDVVFTGATGGTLLTGGMPRLGKNMDLTGASGSFVFGPNIANFTVYGSLTLSSTTGYGSSNTITFAGRTSCTITSAGNTFGGSLIIQAPSGTYTLQDALTVNTAFTLNNGTFDANGFNVTGSTIAGSNTNTRGLTLGSGTWTTTTTGAVNAWLFSTTTGLTFSGDSSTVVISGASANTRTFAGGGLTYGTLRYTEAGSTGTLVITGSNSFSSIQFSDITNARTLQFTASTTTTIRSASGWQVNGTSGKLMTVTSVTAATHTISCATGTIASDYLNLSNSIASGNVPFYAGSHSVDGGGNVNWLIKDDPNAGGVGDDGLTEFLLLKRLLGY